MIHTPHQSTPRQTRSAQSAALNAAIPAQTVCAFLRAIKRFFAPFCGGIFFHTNQTARLHNEPRAAASGPVHLRYRSFFPPITPPSPEARQFLSVCVSSFALVRNSRLPFASRSDAKDYTLTYSAPICGFTLPARFAATISTFRFFGVSTFWGGLLLRNAIQMLPTAQIQLIPHHGRAGVEAFVEFVGRGDLQAVGVLQHHRRAVAADDVDMLARADQR